MLSAFELSTSVRNFFSPFRIERIQKNLKCDKIQFPKIQIKEKDACDS